MDARRPVFPSLWVSNKIKKKDKQSRNGLRPIFVQQDLRETEAIIKQMPVVSSLKTTFLTSLKRKKKKKIEIITRKVQTVLYRIIEQDIDKLVKFNSDAKISRLIKLFRYYAGKISISRYNILSPFQVR
jgi:hypothetical protein